jgi:FkbM family methyltransferase
LTGKELSTLNLDEFGTIEWPSISFGNVTTTDLINLSELTLFHIYKTSFPDYEIALDLGANVGLHSVMMAKAGFKSIIAVEADPAHITNLKNNLLLNKITNVEIRNQAVSDRISEVLFTRVLGNLTGSHIKGSKELVYGEIEEIAVSSFPIRDLMKSKGRIFCKMDIEGHELVAIKDIPKPIWENLDLFVEISSAENALGIFKYCQENGLLIFTEKNCWNAAIELEQIPINWREGTALITSSARVIDKIKPIRSS